MSKISTYEVVPVPKLSDKLIGTSVGGEIEDVTYNFTLLELLDLFLPNIPANNLQGVLDYGNTATQDINLFGTITTTNFDVTGTANLFITYLNEETHIVGGVYDSDDSVGISGQVLTSTGDGVAWVTLPPIFTPNLQQVLTVGNTSTVGIVLDATLEALNVDTDDATINTNITIDGTITDGLAEVGTPGQVLSSTSSGVEWVDLPAYSAVSPLLFNSVTGVFSIQQASNVQGGYLSAADWINFDGKQNAGNYITALTGEATASGPGAASTVLSNAAVIGKVLTGFNPISGTINPSDTILTAFGKTQSQINALVGGVQYKGTWNASTNVPTLQSSVGVQGNYYIVNVAGNTNLNGITDWQVGDWAIFSESTWQKVDNTDSVTSVNGFTGAVSLITDDIPEGTTNLYYLNSRARGALSFAAGSGAYNNVTGVITIPTNNNQILNGAGYITLASLSASSPLAYNNLTGGFSIQKSDATHDGYLSSTDWNTFNNKQNYLSGTGLVKSTAGTISYITDNSSNWNTAYDRSIVSAAVTGTSTKTLTLTEQDGNTIQASWTDLDTGLTSVGVSMPSAFSVANSPLTSNGTIAITGAGTSLQYIDGTGALQTFPGLTGFVPYTGASQNVNLGTYGLLADYLQLNTSPTSIPTTEGTMSWNSTDGTMDLKLKGGNVTLQVGEENVTRVVNKSGIDLLEENYQVVRARKVAEGGAQGQRIAVVLAQGNSENNSTEVLGLVTETILVNQEGFVTCFGEVKEINTTGSLQGETWVDGDILYLSSTVAGGLTNVRPVAPNHSVIVGYVTYAHAVHGKIYMAIDTGYELGELHNVYAPNPTANQSIYWNVANSRYELNTIGGILGYTPANAATLISTTAPLSGGGDLSANRTLSISQAGASTDGYLSSTDWNTFNNKQPAGSYVPTSRTLNINGTSYDLSADRSWSVGTVTSVAALTLGTTGTDLNSTVANSSTTPVITLNVPTASATNRGALSAADWSTFNTKVGSVTASSPLASSGGQTPNITIQQASGSQDGYLSSTDWTTFNSKQAAGNYITSLTGEATASGPGAASVTLNNAAVTGKILTGVNITGGSISATDSILTAFGKVQNQINGLIGSTIYQGTWNASTNTPALTSGVGTRGWYYIVNVAGNTNLDGITDWNVGDWAIFDGTAWQQVDNTDAVTSVNGQTGAVSLTTDNIPEGSTNLYFTNARSRGALSFAAGSGAYNSTTGVITIPTNTNQLTNGASFITLASLSGTAPIQYNNTTGAISITQSSSSTDGYLSSTDWNTFNNKQSALTNPVTGTGTANYLPKFTGTSTIGNSLAYDGGSSIGINTNAPYDSAQFKLDVNGGLLVKNTSGVAAQFVLINSDPAAGGNNGFFIQSVGGTSTSAWGQIQTYYGTSIVAGALRLQPSGGQVLIGTTTSSAFTLDVAGTIRATGQLTLGSTISNGTYTYTLPSATGTLALTSDLSGYVPTSRTLTINGVTYDLSANRTWTITAGISSVSGTSPISVTTVAGAATVSISQANATTNGYLSSTDWNTFNDKVPASRTLTINGVTYDLSANRTWTITPNVNARAEQTYTATAGQTTFTVTGGYTVGQLDVYYNGSKLSPSEFTATNGTTFVLGTAAIVGAIVDAVSYTTGGGIGGSGTTNYIAKFTASGVIGNSLIQDNGSAVSINGSTITDSNLLNIIGNQTSVNIGLVLNNTNTTYSRIYALQNINRNLVIYDYSANAVRLTITDTGAATFANTITSQANGSTFGTASASGRAVIIQSGSTNQAIMFKNSSGGDGTLFINGTSTTMDYNFNTYSTADALVIKNNGNVLIGTNTDNGQKLQATGNLYLSVAGSSHVFFDSTPYGGAYAQSMQVKNNAANGNFYIQRVSDGTGVYIPFGGTSWSGVSDERLKTDLIDIENAIEKVLQLRTVIGRFKTDEVGKRRSFFIAQDMQKVFPEAVNIDEETKMLGIQYSDTNPLLAAAIKELIQKVKDQDVIINQLQNKIL